ncbi:MAG: thioredoxin domain-containing protein [Candidatus Saccharibacteria bacterium]|nr:thioredoxin domain-containing protein [Candidatus Saccharibacteria bacterium]
MQKAIRVGILIAIIGFLGALVIFNSLNPSPIDMTAWNNAMTKGDPETAKHHFVMYTDIFCPYCDKFSDAVAANMDDFDKHYIEENNILFEIRVTDMNYENGHSQNSRPAAQGAYCAAKQGDFWNYYYALLAKIYRDYHSRGIGVDRDSERIPNLPTSYFYDFVDSIEDLDTESMKTCIENGETTAEVDEMTKKAKTKVNGGVPRFVFDKYVADGFYGNWNTDNDYKQVKLLMDAGLASK